MRKHYEAYGRLLRNDESVSGSQKLWDLVVITSINDEQRRCYEKQLQVKLEHRRLPKCLAFKVISDPEDCKIGSGGSTINVIRVLYESYGESLFEMKILLIHAGGYSQRMPTCTVLGKIFSPLAVDNDDINDLLDLKLASFLPFSLNMAPGVYLTSSDDFATFDYDEQAEYGRLFGKDGNIDFALLAHKSSLTIGKDHGVYALDKSASTGLKNVFDCKFVLQKPPVDMMRSKGVVEQDPALGEFVFTDSSFWFSHRVTRALMDIYVGYFSLIQHEKIEVCAYRDFLQPLGTEPLPMDDYLKSAGAAVLAHSDRTRLFKDMYAKFRGAKSLVIGLTDSKFYHLGTLNELFDSYMSRSNPESIQFRQDLCFTRSKPAGQLLTTAAAVVLFSKLLNLAQSELSPNSLIEYCFFDDRVKLVLNDYSLLSNCMVSSEGTGQEVTITVPGNVCMHTVAIKEPPSERKFVTIFFDRNDDLKKVYADFGSIKFLGQTVPKKYERMINASKYASSAPTVWNLKIFQAFGTMTESFQQSLKFVHEYLDPGSASDTSRPSAQFYSLFDILHLKDFEPILSYRADRQLTV